MTHSAMLKQFGQGKERFCFEEKRCFVMPVLERQNGTVGYA